MLLITKAIILPVPYFGIHLHINSLQRYFGVEVVGTRYPLIIASGCQKLPPTFEQMVSPYATVDVEAPSTPRGSVTDPIGD